MIYPRSKDFWQRKFCLFSRNVRFIGKSWSWKSQFHWVATLESPISSPRWYLSRSIAVVTDVIKQESSSSSSSVSCISQRLYCLEANAQGQSVNKHYIQGNLPHKPFEIQSHSVFLMRVSATQQVSQVKLESLPFQFPWAGSIKDCKTLDYRLRRLDAEAKLTTCHGVESCRFALMNGAHSNFFFFFQSANWNIIVQLLVSRKKM